jgi:UDP:flavonoid glycosyltransferase YjiC (YdhE family)
VSDPSYKDGAKVIAEQIKNEDGAKNAASKIQAFVRAS